MTFLNVNSTANQSIDSKVKLIDARGPRFSAAISTLVLATALVSHSAIIIGFQLIIFFIGAFLGPQRTPYAFLFRKFVKPRLHGEVPTEDVRPPQFAQRVGFGFATVSFVTLLVSAPLVATISTSFALTAAFLNAGFNFCLGCEIYLLIARLRSR